MTTDEGASGKGDVSDHKSWEKDHNITLPSPKRREARDFVQYFHLIEHLNRDWEVPEYIKDETEWLTSGGKLEGNVLKGAKFTKIPGLRKAMKANGDLVRQMLIKQNENRILSTAMAAIKARDHKFFEEVALCLKKDRPRITPEELYVWLHEPYEGKRPRYTEADLLEMFDSYGIPITSRTLYRLKKKFGYAFKNSRA